uniref:Uncharacterized protein n=1 Tax=Arundo donax TaxID=35708 RepID=A0A0A9DKA6_ARUDO
MSKLQTKFAYSATHIPKMNCLHSPFDLIDIISSYNQS